MSFDNLTPDERAVLETGLTPPVIRIEFGTDSPLDQPGGLNYEISASDRDVLDKVVADANDAANTTIAEAALSALHEAAKLAFPPYRLGSFVWNLLGRLFGAEFSLSEGAVAFRGERNPEMFGQNSGVIVVRSASYDSATGEAKLEVVAQSETLGAKQQANGNWNVGWTSGRVGLAASGGESVNSYYSDLSMTGQANTTNSDQHNSSEAWESHYEDMGFLTAEYTRTANIGLSQNPQICGATVYDPSDGSPLQYTNFSCRAISGGNGIGDVDPFTLDSLQDGGIGDPSASDLTPTETQDFIDNLKDSPWHDQYGPTPSDGTGGETPGGPGDGTGGGGTTFPGPGDEGYPYEPGGGSPAQGGSLGPGGGNVKLPGGGYDPDDSNYQPGNKICIVIEGEKRCYYTDSYDPDNGNVGLTDTYDDTFDKTTCYKNARVVRVIKELSDDLGIDSDVVVEDGCDKRFTDCFEKGSSKWEALWALADLCGYGGYQPGDGTQGPIEPLDVHHGPYHEFRDLLIFDMTTDKIDLYSHIEVYKTGKRGFAVPPVPIPSNVTWSEYKPKRLRVPKWLSAADAMDYAARQAKKEEYRSKMVEFAVPFKWSIKGRHQMRFRRPSLGYEGNYMVWPKSLTFEMEPGSVWTTKGRAVLLSRERYAPRIEQAAPA